MFGNQPFARLEKAIFLQNLWPNVVLNTFKNNKLIEVSFKNVNSNL